MSFISIQYTPDALRTALGDLSDLPLPFAEAAMAKVPVRGHVTAKQAVLLFMELWGPATTVALIKRHPEVVGIWTRLIDEHGWGQSLVQGDLQLSLLVNAIKAVVTNETPVALKRQELIATLSKELALDPKIDEIVIRFLILEDQLSLPWIVVVPPQAL